MVFGGINSQQQFCQQFDEDKIFFSENDEYVLFSFQIKRINTPWRKLKQQFKLTSNSFPSTQRHIFPLNRASSINVWAQNGTYFAIENPSDSVRRKHIDKKIPGVLTNRNFAPRF